MSKIGSSTIDRRVFVLKFMKEGDLTYTQSCHLYEVMCSVFEEAVTSGCKVTIGRIGAIVPYWKPARDYQMHFRRHGSKMETGIHRTFFMDGRYDFKFKLYRKFMQTRQLKWLVDMPIQ